MAQRPAALVTGGARRIGRAIAEDLAAHGFDIALHFHGSRPEAENAAALMRASGASVELVEGDLLDAAVPEKVFAQACENFGTIALLVNNASVFENDTVQTATAQSLDLHHAIHVRAPSLLTKAFAAQGLQDGLVVNIVDQRVWRLNPNFHSYTLSKAALWAATQTMAQALAPNIRVNAIGPGPTLKNSRQTDADFRQQNEALLLQHGPDLAEFGATVRYLWTAKSVTGQMIALDGGQHLAWETPDVAGIVE